jgi:hypothetical protein
MVDGQILFVTMSYSGGLFSSVSGQNKWTAEA